MVQNGLRDHVRIDSGPPVYIFDEHSEAFYYWQVARHDGLIDGPIDLFHIDAHDDMDCLHRFRQSLYLGDQPTNGEVLQYYRDFARTELHIGGFIVPAVLAGFIRNIYFIYPRWRDLTDRRRRMSVCSIFGEGTRLKHNVKVGSDTDRRVSMACPDLRTYWFTTTSTERIPKARRVILDIDFDYFACRDSVFNHMAFELQITREQFVLRNLILDDARLPHARFEFAFLERKGKYYVKVSHKREEEREHLPTEEEILTEMDYLMERLRAARTRPVAITVSRSSGSGYCPSEYVPFIEAELTRRLALLWAS